MIPAEKPNLVTGDSFSRHIRPIPVTIVGCISGLKGHDIEADLKLLAKRTCKSSKVIINVFTSDNWLH